MAKLKYNCKLCNKEFERYACNIKYENIFCSLSCRSKSHPSGALGKHWKLTEENKKNIREKSRRGENHYLWKKDRTQLVQSEKKHLDGRYREWMFAVKNRDNWVCRIADINCDGRLEAHHILPWKDYPELRYEINNGITLCHAHHPRGRENEAKLSPFFQQMVAEVK